MITYIFVQWAQIRKLNNLDKVQIAEIGPSQLTLLLIKLEMLRTSQSHSISHNFSLEGSIPTFQTFFYT